MLIGQFLMFAFCVLIAIQLVWFIAPTVTLCEQQHEVFEKNLPNYSALTLSGNDGVDHWSTKHEWDTVLTNIRIVISTPRVLLDALSHAFVKMSTIGLLIFDEAHHVNLKHPANLIMTDFYHPRLKAGSAGLPRILGLSASPAIKAQSAVQTLQYVRSRLGDH
jgi:ERCC4-related helicase